MRFFTAPVLFADFAKARNVTAQNMLLGVAVDGHQKRPIRSTASDTLRQFLGEAVRLCDVENEYTTRTQGAVYAAEQPLQCFPPIAFLDAIVQTLADGRHRIALRNFGL